MTALSIVLGIVGYNIITILFAAAIAFLFGFFGYVPSDLFTAISSSFSMIFAAWAVQAMVKKLCSVRGNAAAALKVVGAFVIIMACAQFADGNVGFPTYVYLLSGVALWYISSKKL